MENFRLPFQFFFKNGKIWKYHTNRPLHVHFFTHTLYKLCGALLLIIYNLIGLVVKALDSQSSSPMFKVIGWLQGQLTQSFILLRSIEGVPGISGNLFAKSKLPSRSGFSLEAVEPHPEKGTIKLKFLD